jgi:putative ATP-dependent endonuclease of OLD family
MVTTHSPAFIDLSRDNTTVVRVERDVENDVITGTTVFRPDRVNLSDDDKEELKMLNLCDPHLCEFFFGVRSVIVEGDTVYTAFKYVISRFPQDENLRDVHIVRARGKSTICLLARILNQFNARYAVLHDSDNPKILKKAKGSDEKVETVNPAWTNNGKILDTVKDAVEAGRVRLVALIPNFELALVGEAAPDEKPYRAWSALRGDNQLCEKVYQLLRSLVDFDAPVPDECLAWVEENALSDKWSSWNDAQQ